jgi:hypothetical protein
MAQILHTSWPEQSNGYAGAQLFGGSRAKDLIKKEAVRSASNAG